MLVLPEITIIISSFLKFVLQKEKDYVTIYLLPQKIRVGCIYFDADSVGVGVSTNVSIYALIYAQFILNGYLDFDQNLPVYNNWTCQTPIRTL